MRKLLLLTLLLCSTGFAGSALAQWSTITLDQPYRYWHRDPDGTLFDDVLNLAPSTFTNQTFANPHIQYNDNGEWLIMGYGDNNLGGTAVGDAIYVMKRLNSGWYRVPANPALTFGAAPSGQNWTNVGGLGAGAAIAKTSAATTGGYKYFSAVQVGKAPMVNGTFSLGWTSWAVSQDGETWSFVSQSGGLTNDPAQSLQLIRRGDLSGQGNKFYHIAMVYNPSDQYFYIVMGWAGVCGIKGTWWRMHFNPSNPYGLTYNGSTYEIQVLQNNSQFVNTTTVGTGQVSNGLITDYSDSWQCNAQSPTGTTAGPADPMDIVQLYKQNGTFDSMLFIYSPEYDVSKISYVKASLPQTSDGIFVWGTPQTLDLSPLLNGEPDGTKYSNCGAGGFMMCVNQNGWQANGAPNLFGFVATWRTDIHSAAGDCSIQSQGLLPLHFTLN